MSLASYRESLKDDGLYQDDWTILHLLADDKRVKPIDYAEFKYNLTFHPERRMAVRGTGFWRIFHHGKVTDISDRLMANLKRFVSCNIGEGAKKDE